MHYKWFRVVAIALVKVAAIIFFTSYKQFAGLKHVTIVRLTVMNADNVE